MSIRLIASDMDGTLLDPYTNISQANIDAIHRLWRGIFNLQRPRPSRC